MQTIFTFIRCAMGRAYDVAASAVDLIEPAPEIYSVSGKFDLLAKFALDDTTDPGRFVTEKVQALPGVIETSTIIAFNAFTPARPRPWALDP